MAEALLILAMVSLVAVFAWNLGVRRERGRQAKLEEIQQKVLQDTRRKRGTRLRSIQVRRRR